MNIEELLAKHKAGKKPKTSPHRLRKKEYQRHYPLIREAVEKRVPLRTAIRIVKDSENAFEGIAINTVWQAYRRALLHDQIKLSEIDR
jgi:hypothetical protein